MLSIAIDRVDARYRLPRAAMREQPRMQRIVDAALERVLEGAIERHGIGRDGYVCIRDVRAVVNVRLREPDAALASGVGDAIAVAVRRLIDERSPSVVEYGSRAHALVDLASSALAGDFSRSWAWAQVGIWRADFPVRADVTADLIVRALAKEPTHAVAVAAHLARERTDRFHALVERATPKSWTAAARAALAAARATALHAGPADAAGEWREPIGDAPQTQPLTAIAQRLVAHSAIARASTDRLAGASVETRAALSALVLLEAEPSAAGREDLPRLLRTIEHAMALPAAPVITHRPEVHDRFAAADAAAPGGRQSVPRRERGDGHAMADETDTSPVHAIPTDSNSRSESVSRRDEEDALRAGRTGADTADTINRKAAERELPPEERVADITLPRVRAMVRTQHGGLLYLVNLLTRIGLVDTIAADPWWSDRGLRWVLHQLAMALAAVEPNDPAALVFAGLTPGTAPPSSLQDPPTELERAALETLRDVIVEALRDALGESSDRDAASDDAVVAGVCVHPAQIVADPGWIEVHFSLEDVSLGVRRAGLDRNPDWVPWLGIVLRFVYA